MSGSKLAEEIDREYKIKKIFSKKKRQQCKNFICKECKYKSICESREEDYDYKS